MQSKHESAKEASAIAVSNFVATWAILFAWTLTSDFILTVVLTIKAVAIGYLIRRLFNHKVTANVNETDGCNGCGCSCSGSNSKATGDGVIIHGPATLRRHD